MGKHNNRTTGCGFHSFLPLIIAVSRGVLWDLLRSNFTFLLLRDAVTLFHHYSSLRRWNGELYEKPFFCLLVEAFFFQDWKLLTKRALSSRGGKQTLWSGSILTWYWQARAGSPPLLRSGHHEVVAGLRHVLYIVDQLPDLKDLVSPMTL